MMIKNAYRNILIILGTVILFVAVLLFTIKTPTLVRVNSISFETMENGIIKANTMLLLQNNNWFSYNVSDAAVKIRYNEKIICEGNFIKPILLAKSKESFHELKLNFFTDSLKWEIPGMIFKDSLKLEITLEGKIAPFMIDFETSYNKYVTKKSILTMVTKQL